MQHFMVSTVSAACACRCIAAVSCALPVVPGAIWRKRVRSGVRSSSARRLCSGLQATGSASPTAASRRRGCPGSQQQPATARQIPQHYVRLPQHAPTSPSISLPSRLRYRAVMAKPTCSSAAFPWPWRSSRCGLCGAGLLAAQSTGLAGWPCGLSAYDAGWKRGQPLRACCWHCRAGPQGEAA